MSRGIFAALSPSDCRLCAAPLQNISRLPVCEECIAAIQPIVTETCGVCGEALPALSGGGAARGLCSACQETPSLFAKAVAFGAYDEQLRELIHLLKYEKIIPAAGVLGKYPLAGHSKTGSAAESADSSRSVAFFKAPPTPVQSGRVDCPCGSQAHGRRQGAVRLRCPETRSAHGFANRTHAPAATGQYSWRVPSCASKQSRGPQYSAGR